MEGITYKSLFENAEFRDLIKSARAFALEKTKDEINKHNALRDFLIREVEADAEILRKRNKLKALKYAKKYPKIHS